MYSEKLTVGNFGDEVVRLHENLKKHGLFVSEDEIKRKFFGPTTRDAICKLQNHHGLEVSGEVNKETAAKLFVPIDGSAVSAIMQVNDASDRSEMSDDSNELSFGIPDRHQLPLDKDLTLKVLNPAGAEAVHQGIMHPSVVREQPPIKVLTKEIVLSEPGTPASLGGRTAGKGETERTGGILTKEVVLSEPRTPVSLRGRTVWKGETKRMGGFEGFRITANYQARQEGLPDYVPQSASTVLTSDRFAIPLPNKEVLKNEPVRVEVKYATGETATIVSFDLEQLREEVVIEIEPPVQHTVGIDSRVEDAKPDRLKGKVIDVEGKHSIRNKQVILWGISSKSTIAKPVVVVMTDGYGNFSADRPKETFHCAFATVAGTLNATVENGVGIDLELLSTASEEAGRLPKFVYIAVSLPHDFGKEDGTRACGSLTPRQPDPEDLVKNPSTYSQDIGLNCVNFTTPNRTLEEFTYTMVVRTTDPEIKGTTLSDLDRRAVAHKFENLTDYVIAGKADVTKYAQAEIKSAAALEASPAAMRIADVAKYAPTEIKSMDAMKRYNLQRYNLWRLYLAKHAMPSEGLLKTVSGRAELNANNSIDWDSTPTFYQATTIAHGHILYYKQIWKADGYSLGDLVYSLPLAPGQKKQVVIFDWDRTEYGRRDEETHEDEALNAYLSQNRDVSDIAHGFLTEHVKGGSTSHVSGEAGGVGGAVGGLFQSVMVGVAGGYSASSGSSSSSAWQDSSRETAASGFNQLRNMIQQGASAVRNQRSTVVQTARQTERFRVETEVVANHNHCHTITIEYFEVLRHYAIEQKLTHVQECLFIPLLMSEFKEDKVMRWKHLLRPAVRDLNPRNIFRLSTGGYSYRNKPLSDGFDAVERKWNGSASTEFPATTYAAEEVLDLSGDLYITLSLNRPRDKNDEAADNPIDEEEWNFFPTLGGWDISYIFTKYFAKKTQQERDRIFEEQLAPKIAEGFIDTLHFKAIDKDGNGHQLYVDSTLLSSYQRDAQLYVSIRPTQGKLNVTREQIAKLVIYTKYDLSETANSRIIVRSGTFRYRTAHFDGVLYRNDAINNDMKSISIKFSDGSDTIPTDNVTLYTPLSTEELRNPLKEDEELIKRLLTHLNANIEAYHKVIWSRMDPDRRYMLLDGFEAPYAKGKSVASVVENRVIGIAGNSLIMPVAPGYKLDPSYDYEPELDEEGQPRHDERGNTIFKRVDLLDHYQPLTPIPPFRVSVPTRGVFAEVIQGACNSCEKKEEERFWRWEQSPNPDEPTPINPIQTIPPARTETELKPTPFPTPMINIQNAPAAPEPGATLAGTLGLLGKQGLFPDITGLDQTQKNALQAMLSNQESAKHYADKASELAVQAANLREGSTTIESIKKSIGDGTLDKDAGKKLIEDAYRAQISGKTSSDQAINTANNSPLGKAAAEAVQSGREVKASQTHPDGTQISVDQKTPVNDQETPAKDATGASTIDTVLEDPIPVIAQPNDNACWATVLTMMVNWKEKPSTPYTIEEVLTRAGAKYLAIFKAEKGIDRVDKGNCIANLGMVADEGNFQSHNYDYFAKLIDDYGPIWVTVDVSDVELAKHAKIVYGVRGDGTPSGTKILIIDPNRGVEDEESFEKFIKEYEDVVRETPPKEELFIQIVRFKDKRQHRDKGKGSPSSVINDAGTGEGESVSSVTASLLVATTPFIFSAMPITEGKNLTSKPKGHMKLSIEEALKDARANNKIDSKVKIAVFDMTDGSLDYGGLDDTDMVFCASLLKIAPLAAAFALKQAFKDFSKGAKNIGTANIISEVEKSWGPAVKKRFVNRPEDFPKFKRVFEITPISASFISISFNHNDKLQKPELAKINNANKSQEIRSLKFYERMRLMAQFSNTFGAATTIQDLGFQYIMGTMVDLGLYDESNDKGLWLSKDYMGGNWGSVPNFSGQRATARSVAMFFAALALRQFGSVSSEVLDILDDHGTDSYIEEGIKKAIPHVKFDTHASKIGLYEMPDLPKQFGQASDGGFFERKVGNKTIKYAVAVLNGSSKYAVQKAAVIVDEIILKRNT